jgi:hypothetical protein
MDEAGDAHGSRGYRRRESLTPACRIIVGVSSHLSRIPTAKRRQLAATLGLFAMLCFTVGAVALTGPSSAVLHVTVGVMWSVAIVLALVGWGVVTSVQKDVAEQRLDSVITDTIAAGGGVPCACGHDHDPTEMHVVDPEAEGKAGDACAHDGGGAACAHDCDTCVLSAMRTSAAPADRPSPRPRPRPTPSR